MTSIGQHGSSIVSKYASPSADITIWVFISSFAFSASLIARRTSAASLVPEMSSLSEIMAAGLNRYWRSFCNEYLIFITPHVNYK